MRQVKVTVEFIGSEEDGEEVIDILRLIADQIRAKKEKENDDD